MKRRFLLRWVDDGHCDILRNGRQLRAGISWTAAAKWLLKNATDEDIITREESDGYQVRVKLSTLR